MKSRQSATGVSQGSNDGFHLVGYQIIAAENQHACMQPAKSDCKSKCNNVITNLTALQCNQPACQPTRAIDRSHIALTCACIFLHHDGNETDRHPDVEIVLRKSFCGGLSTSDQILILFRLDNGASAWYRERREETVKLLYGTWNRSDSIGGWSADCQWDSHMT